MKAVYPAVPLTAPSILGIIAPVTYLLVPLDSRLCSASFLGHFSSDLLVQHLPSVVACVHKDGALLLVRALVSPAIGCYRVSHHSSGVALS